MLSITSVAATVFYLLSCAPSRYTDAFVMPMNNLVNSRNNKFGMSAVTTFHTNFGDIKVQVNEEKAPETSANFLQYCRDGYYDNTLFHRVIDGFMIQGGGMESGLREKATRDPIRNEANNGLSNRVGTIAMARTMEPHSASAQFFINVNDNTMLDFRSETMDGWGYCVFAEVVQGMDVVNKIKGVSTGSYGMHQDVPLEDVIITGTSIE